MSDRKPLPTATPESLGIPSGAILRFIDRLERARVPMHSFVVLRHGKVAAEGYWKPFHKDFLHRMYSSSKSFASLAIGCLADEGKLKLSDTVASYFPEKLPPDPHPYNVQATVRDLLMMSSQHAKTSYVWSDPDWVWTFFNKKPSHPSGTVFNYDTSATTVLGALVEKLSGMKVLDYLRSKGFDSEMGFSPEAWCVETPEGVSWCGSGMLMTARDFAKTAQLCLNKGRWNGRQIISEEYITAATSKQVDIAHKGEPADSPLGAPGYGYQFWMVQGGGYAFRGLGSQFAFVFPEQDFILVTMADTQGFAAGGEISFGLYDDLLAALSDSPLPEDEQAQSALYAKLESLALIPKDGQTDSPVRARVDGVRYVLGENPMGLKDIRFTFSGDEGVMEYTNQEGHFKLPFGIGKYWFGKFPQNTYFYHRIGLREGIAYDSAVSAAWVEPHKLGIDVFSIDAHMGACRMQIGFKDEKITVYMSKSAEWFFTEYDGIAAGAAEGSSL